MMMDIFFPRRPEEYPSPEQMEYDQLPTKESYQRSSYATIWPT